MAFRSAWPGILILVAGCSGGGGGGGGIPPPRPEPLAPPTSLSAAALSSREVVLSWIDASDDETVFLVERAPDLAGAPGTWVSAGVVLADHTAFYESDLLPEGTYWYRVSALKGDTPTLPSEPVSVTLLRSDEVEAPPAVTDLWLEVVSSSAITAHWSDTSDDEVVYVVERARDDAGAPGAWRVAGVTPADSTSFADEGLDAGTTYWYRVKALREENLESTSDPASAATEDAAEPSAPRAPVEVAAAAQSTSSVLVTWLDGGDDAPVFHVQRAPDANGAPGEWSSAGTVLAGTSSFVVVGLDAGTTHWFRVLSSDLDGHTESATAVSETTLVASEPTPPAAPAITSIASASTTAVELTWSDESPDEVAFIVERKVDDGLSEWEEAGTVSADAVVFVDRGLTAETAYLYRVSAVTAVGLRGTSAIAQVATPAEGEPLPPSAPAALALEALSSSTILVSWADTSDDEVVFAVERAPDVSGVPGEWESLRALVADTTSCQDSGLDPETTYWYRVRALGVGSLSSVSEPAVTITQSLTAPEMPQDLAANVQSSSRVALTWTDTSNNEAVFIIEVALDVLGGPGEFNTDGYAPPDASEYLVDGLEPSTLYWFRVTALATNNLTTSSGAVSASTPAREDPDVPVAPGITSLTALSDTTVEVIWSDQSDDEVGFIVERALDDGGEGTDWTDIGSVLGDVTVYLDRTTERETSYLYRVTAYITAEISSTSAAAGVTTPRPTLNPETPEDLTAVALSSEVVSIEWTDTSDNEAQFLLERADDYGGEPASWEIVQVLPEGTTQTTDAVSAGETYWYRVTAYLVGDLAATSNEDSVTTPLNDLEAPEIVSVAAVSTSAITLAWTGSTDGGSHFVVERAPVEEGPGEWEEIATLDLDITEYTDSDLPPATSYYYRIVLHGDESWPAASEEVLEKTGWASDLGGANGSIAMVIGADGKIHVWGSSGAEMGLGEVGVDHYARPTAIDTLSDVVQVSVGDDHVLALDAEGRVWAWGENSDFQVGSTEDSVIYTPYHVPELSSVVQVAAGSYHSLALKSNGTVWAWGSDSSGRRGIEPNGEQWIPVQVPGLEDIVEIAAGEEASLALDAAGHVYAWGGNDEGALGDGTLDDHTVPAQISGLEDITKISLRIQSAFALRDDGRLFAWGENDDGVLGVGDENWAELIPVLVPYIQHVVDIDVFESHSAALDASGNVWTTGYNGDGQLGDGALDTRYFFEQISGLDGTVTTVAVGDDATYALLSTGEVQSWGSNWSGELGTGETSQQLTAAEIPDLEGIAALSAGDSNSMALLQDGSVWIWGSSDSGALGNALETRAAWTPIQLEVPAGFAVVEAGDNAGFAVIDDETRAVVSWGNNYYGQLGDGTTEDRSQPVTVLGLTGVTALATGGAHVLALKSDGSVWAWGANWYGQIGNGTTDQSNVPVEVSGLSNAVAVAAGYYYSLVLLADGTVWAWGANWAGQLGNGSAVDSSVPVQVAGIEGMTSIACGYDHSLALDAEGVVWSWGANWAGQLGDGTTGDQLSPVEATLLSPALQISTAGDTSFALQAGGQIAAVGEGDEGTLNNGTVDEVSDGVVTSTIEGAIQIEGAATGSHVLCLRSDGSAVAWGDNDEGQLGLGEMLPWSTVPVYVLSP